ncbi:MAG: toll/interleukin-1 receptor domain-containing protein [Anaerolineales bacterium]|nr:toll/interleukin-1 receptor domain-containing protein [Anaerolineales bacterium]
MSGQDEKKLLVFISHASEDNAAAKRLTKRLKDDGFDPWLDLDRLLPGQDWNLEIEKAMRESGAILLCFSEESVSKESYIQKEYKRAMRIQEEKPEGTIFVIPVRLDECELPFYLREIQWVDYPDDYDRLVAALNVRAGRKAMVKKEEEKKKEPKPRKPTASQKADGPNIVVHGNINVGGNWINRDQHNTITNNYITNNISSPADFVAALNQLKAEIEALKAQPNLDSTVARRLNTVEGDIQDVITEAESDKPVAERIKSTLESAKDTMDRISGSIGSAVTLGTTLGNLALMALKVFGG